MFKQTDHSATSFCGEAVCGFFVKDGLQICRNIAARQGLKSKPFVKRPVPDDIAESGQGEHCGSLLLRIFPSTFDQGSADPASLPVELHSTFPNVKTFSNFFSIQESDREIFPIDRYPCIAVCYQFQMTSHRLHVVFCNPGKVRERQEGFACRSFDPGQFLGINWTGFSDGIH